MAYYLNKEEKHGITKYEKSFAGIMAVGIVLSTPGMTDVVFAETSGVIVNETNLTKLNCGYNQITSLDVSKNTKLTTLDCYANELTELNVSKNTELTNLDCYANQITTLDVSKNTKLTYLSCWENKLKSLDVSKNTQLKWLVHCRGWHKVLLQEQRSSYQSVVRGTGQLVLSER